MAVMAGTGFCEITGGRFAVRCFFQEERDHTELD